MSFPSESSSTRDGIVAVIVTYILNPNLSGDFLSLANAHAKHTQRFGRGCIRYDVLSITDDKVACYELYESMDAFEEHASSEYLAKFRRQRAPMVRYHKTLVGRLANP